MCTSRLFRDLPQTSALVQFSRWQPASHTLCPLTWQRQLLRKPAPTPRTVQPMLSDLPGQEARTRKTSTQKWRDHPSQRRSFEIYSVPLVFTIPERQLPYLCHLQRKAAEKESTQSAYPCGRPGWSFNSWLRLGPVLAAAAIQGVNPQVKALFISMPTPSISPSILQTNTSKHTL